MTRARIGDRHAFAALYSHYKRRIYSVCLQMTGDVSTAEDLTQEAFLQVFRKIGTQALGRKSSDRPYNARNECGDTNISAREYINDIDSAVMVVILRFPLFTGIISDEAWVLFLWPKLGNRLVTRKTYLGLGSALSKVAGH